MSRRRPRLALLAAGTLALLPIAVAGVTGASATPASAAGVDIKPPSTVESGDVPGCGTLNMQFDDHWGATSEIGSGSTVLVGTTWKVTGWVFADTQLDFPGNDGPDPLNLELAPTGPVSPGAAPVGSQDFQNGFVAGGDGFTGPVAQYGNWGYSFDFDSDAGLLDLMGDGVDGMVTVTLKATAPGEIQMDRMEVSGWDSTPPAAAIGCALDLGWYWTVIPAAKAVANSEYTKADARYTNTEPGDANQGPHTIRLDVLDNDKDQNGDGGLGDTTEVRVKSWTAVSVHGGFVSCGTQELNGLPVSEFAQMATGSCFYTPAVGFSGTDNFQYSIVQKSDLTVATAKVYIDVLPNGRPSAPDAAFAAAQNDDAVLSLSGVVVDVDGDPMECTGGGPADPAVGTVTVEADCDVVWDNTDGAFTGLVTFPYTVCDLHPLLQDADLAPVAERTSGYADSDLDATTGRRCAVGEATINVITGAIIPPSPKSDLAAVDAHDGEAYRIVIPVSANDTDGNGPAPSDVDVLDGPDPSEGVVAVGGGWISFTSVPGFTGVVHFTYVNCENPALQNPPYEGLPFCGVGHVYVTVVGNLAPLAVDDDLGVVDHSAQVVVADGNDAEPDGDPTTCASAGAPTVGAFAAVQVNADCTVEFDPEDGFTGPATIPYQLCDSHHLLNTPLAGDPYGSDGSQPGDERTLCSTANVVMDIQEPGFESEPADPGGLPTCLADEFQVAWNSEHQLDVLANDSDVDGNGDPSPLTLKAPDGNQSTQGGSVDAQNGQLVYMPAAGFVGWDETTYSAVDTDLQGCTALVRILVIGDLDGDGVPNGEDPDPDGDGLPNPQDPDDDNDGVPDGQDPDDNGDGIPDPPSGGGLPSTGSSTPVLALLAAALVVFGSILLRVRRTA